MLRPGEFSRLRQNALEEGCGVQFLHKGEEHGVEQFKPPVLGFRPELRLLEARDVYGEARHPQKPALAVPDRESLEDHPAGSAVLACGPALHVEEGVFSGEEAFPRRFSLLIFLREKNPAEEVLPGKGKLPVLQPEDGSMARA